MQNRLGNLALWLLLALPFVTGCYENFGPANRLSRVDPVWPDTEATGPSSVTVDGAGRLHALWTTLGILTHRSSVDGGATWSEVRRISDVTSTDVLALSDVRLPDRIFAITKLAHVSYDTIRVEESPDGGASWTNSQFFAPNLIREANVRAAQSPNGLLVIGHVRRNAQQVQDEIVLTSSMGGGGAVWSSPLIVQVSSNQPYRVQERLRLWDLAFMPNGDLHVLYSSTYPDSTNSLWATVTGARYYTKRSSNNGVTWSRPVALGPFGTPPTQFQDSGADLTLNGSELTAAFATEKRLFTASTARGGTAWLPASRVNDLRNPAYNVTLTPAPGDLPILLSWRETDNINYRVWDGSAWSVRRRLNNYWNKVDDGSLGYGGMASLPEGQMAAIWTDHRWSYDYGSTVLSISDPESTTDFGVSFDDTTLFTAKLPGRPVFLQYRVGNWTDTAARKDVWLTYTTGWTNGLLKLDRRVSLSANREVTLSYSGRLATNAFATMDMVVNVGTYPSVVIDSDAFTFRPR